MTRWGDWIRSALDLRSRFEVFWDLSRLRRALKLRRWFSRFYTTRISTMNSILFSWLALTYRSSDLCIGFDIHYYRHDWFDSRIRGSIHGAEGSSSEADKVQIHSGISGDSNHAVLQGDVISVWRPEVVFFGMGCIQPRPDENNNAQHIESWPGSWRMGEILHWGSWINAGGDVRFNRMVENQLNTIPCHLEEGCDGTVDSNNVSSCGTVICSASRCSVSETKSIVGGVDWGWVDCQSQQQAVEPSFLIFPLNARTMKTQKLNCPKIWILIINSRQFGYLCHQWLNINQKYIILQSTIMYFYVVVHWLQWGDFKST